MEHHMIYDAKIKKHSTFTEAIEEGRTVGADFIMLTHFSQRYSKLPVLEEMKDQPRVGIAFDMMEVCPSTMHLIPALYPALSRHFATYMQEMAERTHQYKVNCQFPILCWSRLEAFCFITRFTQLSNLGAVLRGRPVRPGAAAGPGPRPGGPDPSRQEEGEV